MKHLSLSLDIDRAKVTLDCLHRPGTLTPIVPLHGFGSTKEDYADLAMHPGFEGREIFCWDAPGCGLSTVDDPEALSIPFLTKVAAAACDAVGIETCHISGHSMGGLTALYWINSAPARFRSFTNIEGNIAPEDCFLSRQIISDPADKAFRDRIRTRAEYGSGVYAAGLSAKVRNTSFEPIFRSMVALSDEAPLMDMFTGLPFPRCFVYGEQNRHLSYLGELPAMGVQLIEIAASGHFPMYSNPPALWAEMANFLKNHDMTA